MSDLQTDDCDHDGGTLLPYNGNWVGAVEGDESVRALYCFECGDVFEVTRRNVDVERVGNVEGVSDDG